MRATCDLILNIILRPVSMKPAFTNCRKNVFKGIHDGTRVAINSAYIICCIPKIINAIAKRCLASDTILQNLFCFVVARILLTVDRLEITIVIVQKQSDSSHATQVPGLYILKMSLKELGITSSNPIIILHINVAVKEYLSVSKAMAVVRKMMPIIQAKTVVPCMWCEGE
ncbi:MAG: hypothetical protein ABIO32_15380 [Ferruginibacter sp.]